MIINPIIYDEKGRGNDVFSSNLGNRVIHLIGEINDEMASTIVAQLLHLASCGEEDIQLFINSPGGSVSAGMAIYDTMQYIKPDVSTICIGHAASMGAVILSGGAKGKRGILPHSEVMVHQPSGATAGQATDMLIAADHIRSIRAVLNNILSDNCDKTIEEVEKKVERDSWMNAKEAVEFGIVDRIIKYCD